MHPDCVGIDQFDDSAIFWAVANRLNYVRRRIFQFARSSSKSASRRWLFLRLPSRLTYMTWWHYDWTRRSKQRHPIAQEENNNRKPHSEIIIVFCRSFPICLTIVDFLRKVGSAAAKVSPSGKNNFVWKPDPDILLVVCWHYLTNSHHFRVVCVNLVRQLCGRHLAGNLELNFIKSQIPTSFQLLEVHFTPM